MKLTITFILGILLVLPMVAGTFTLEKHLVQLEVDENYPCHIEGDNAIVCPALTNEQIVSWKNAVASQMCDPEIDVKCDNTKLVEQTNLLNKKQAPYSGKTSRNLDITKEYRERVDVYNLDSEIRIGFATNVFGVSSTPLENFDVNTTTGQVTYRPLNMTWLNFQIVNSYISITSITLDTTSNYTFSIWFKVKDIPASSKYQKLLMGNPTTPSGLGFNNDTGFLDFCVSTGTSYNSTRCANSSTIYNDNNWHNAVGVRNYTNQSLYVDGVLISTTNNPIQIDPVDLSSIGGASIGGAGSSFFNGSLDDVRIYNTSLSGSEITTIYSNNRVRNTSTLNSINDNNQVLYLPINEYSSTRTHDISTKSNNGTITGATWQTDRINVTTLGYQVNISIVNMTSALVFWDNFTLINQSRTGNQTFSFMNNQTFYILDNFNLTEGVARTNSPIWFSSSSDIEKHIASNLTDTINVSVYINKSNSYSCNSIKSITYSSNTGTYKRSYNGNDAQDLCSDTTGIISMGNLEIEQASSSGVISISYENLLPYCESLQENMGLYGSFFGAIILALVVVVVIGIIQQQPIDMKTLILGGVVTLVLGAIFLIFGVIMVEALC